MPQSSITVEYYKLEGHQLLDYNMKLINDQGCIGKTSFSKAIKIWRGALTVDFGVFKEIALLLYSIFCQSEYLYGEYRAHKELESVFFVLIAGLRA